MDVTKEPAMAEWPNVGLADWVDTLLDSDTSAQTGLSDSAFLTAQQGNSEECTAVTALTESPSKVLPAVLESGAIWGAIDPTKPPELGRTRSATLRSSIGEGTEGATIQSKQTDDGRPNNLLSWMEKIFKGDQQHQEQEQQKKQEQQKQQEQEKKQEQQWQQEALQNREPSAAPRTAPSLTVPIQHGEQVLEFDGDTRITAVLSNGAFGYNAAELVNQSVLELAYAPQRVDLFHALQVLNRMSEIQSLMLPSIGGIGGIGVDAPRQSIRCLHHVVVRVSQRVQVQLASPLPFPLTFYPRYTPDLLALTLTSPTHFSLPLAARHGHAHHPRGCSLLAGEAPAPLAGPGPSGLLGFIPHGTSAVASRRGEVMVRVV